MKISRLRSIFVAAVILGIAWSCQQDEELIKPQEESNFLNELDMQGMTKLGQKLENPYSVENMRKAWENLKSAQPNARISEGDMEITPTHLYIRFKPKNEDELAILQRDSTLILYTYPLDYEIKQVGDFYHDPEIPVGQPTYQYCAVEVDKKLPEGVKFEILEECFIPDEDYDDNENQANSRITSIGSIEALVDEALRITGNLEEEASDYSNARRSKWRPAGRILFTEEFFVGGTRVIRNNPVVGAKVRARRWLTTHEGITDANGRFSCNGRFKRDANYSIKWERNDFDIRSGTFGQAIFNGPKRRGDWNLTISSGKSRMYAIVHTAAQQYYYGNRYGLKSPPRNSFWRSRVKIAVYDKDGTSRHCKDCRTFGLIPRLYIRNPDRTSDQIYGTTIHELAHASHWELRRGEWNDNNTEKRLKESWAQGVEWLFAVERYRSFNAGYNYQGNYQNRTPADDPVYTSLMVDLNDNFDQSIRGGGRPVDRVDGYTFPQMESCLGASNGFEQYRDQLRNRYTNGTENFLNELFNNWN